MNKTNRKAVLLMMFNSGTQDTNFALPLLALGSRWELAFDTALPTPQDEIAAATVTNLDLSKPYPLKHARQHDSLKCGQHDNCLLMLDTEQTLPPRLRYKSARQRYLPDQSLE